MTDMREKARELTRTTYDLASFEVASNEIESALREARNAALEEAAGVCADKFKSSSPEDAAFVSAAHLCAADIRALKDKE